MLGSPVPIFSSIGFGILFLVTLYTLTQIKEEDIVKNMAEKPYFVKNRC
ncbi:hypothetical protein HMPREF0083_03387 [Aneurinibacillus aneurinilyticus ATCC 12856]|jgi:hypothetical protein|uniref:Uncharacterized protein n=1 Tax=Aneurinibacillus aneurinilyticus ATCC 12856 TaxID=649747 RepID=U1Y8P8_ANEAE|nr:hypothetical protein HMPREF0083_03387 [Aneurinibacillus aneurinilyticus ATCC 12856]